MSGCGSARLRWSGRLRASQKLFGRYPFPCQCRELRPNALPPLVAIGLFDRSS